MQIREDSALPVCAMRYALGRHTYIVRRVIDEIIPILSKLSDKDLYVMNRDIAEHLEKIEDNRSIDDYDWEEFQRAVQRERKRRDGLHRD